VVDTLTPGERSARMSLVRSARTKPEIRFREVIRRIVGRHRRIEYCSRRLPGRPDAVIPGLGVAIFVHGCFWHRCPAHARTPKSRVEFWSAKLDANARRDSATARALRRLGWSVWTIWEHDLTASRLGRTTALISRRIARRELQQKAASRSGFSSHS
jgi:DNA mismatch endonuclease, patch repair protein